jgi:hypothetical protein
MTDIDHNASTALVAGPLAPLSAADSSERTLFSCHRRLAGAVTGETLVPHDQSFRVLT